MGSRNTRLITFAVIIGLLFVPKVFAGRASTAFPGKTIPYKGDAGIQAAVNFFGTASTAGYMDSLDGVLSPLVDNDYYDSSDSAIFSGVQIKAGTVDINVTSDFANTLTITAPIDSGSTADFDGTVNLDDVIIDATLDQNGTVDFATTVTFNGSTSGIDHGELSGLSDDDHPQYYMSGDSATLSGLTVNGAITANSTLDVTDTTTLTGVLDANNTADFDTTVAIDGDTFVTDPILGANGYNTTIGLTAGDAIQNGAGDTGKKNTFYGYGAGTAVTTGWRNTFVGYSAGDVPTTGLDNTGVGANALGGGNGSGNVAIGINSGSTATGSYNTFLGYQTDVGGGSYNIMIGYRPTPPKSNNDSYQLAIGNYTATDTDRYAVLSDSIGEELNLYGTVAWARAESNFVAGDTTPSIYGGTMWATSDTSVAYTVTRIDGGIAGAQVIIRAVSDTTVISDTTNLNLAGDWTPDAGDILRLYTTDGTAWYEISRSAN